MPTKFNFTPYRVNTKHPRPSDGWLWCEKMQPDGLWVYVRHRDSDRTFRFSGRHPDADNWYMIKNHPEFVELVNELDCIYKFLSLGPGNIGPTCIKQLDLFFFII